MLETIHNSGSNAVSQILKGYNMSWMLETIYNSRSNAMSQRSKEHNMSWMLETINNSRSNATSERSKGIICHGYLRPAIVSDLHLSR